MKIDIVILLSTLVNTGEALKESTIKVRIGAYRRIKIKAR